MVRQLSSSTSGVSDASIAISGERAWNRMMAWIALYVPTYGTSMVFHAALILLAAFMIPIAALERPIIPALGGVTFTPPPIKSQKRPDDTRPPRSRGRLKPQDSGFVRTPLENRIRGIALDETAEFIPVIGWGGNRKIGDLPEGEGRGRGGGLFPKEPQEEGARRIVYVVDRSGSMTDSLYIVKMELRTSITEVGEETEFHVIFYSSGAPIEMPTRRLVHATERNKRLAYEFIDTVIAGGETDPSQAIKRAFAVRPELVYLLTDGEFDRGIIDLVKRLNVGGGVRVFTIGFLYTHPGTAGEGILKRIAAENGGEYKFVSEQDLASLVGGV